MFAPLVIGRYYFYNIVHRNAFLLYLAYRRVVVCEFCENHVGRYRPRYRRSAALLAGGWIRGYRRGARTGSGLRGRGSANPGAIERWCGFWRAGARKVYRCHIRGWRFPRAGRPRHATARIAGRIARSAARRAFAHRQAAIRLRHPEGRDGNRGREPRWLGARPADRPLRGRQRAVRARRGRPSGVMVGPPGDFQTGRLGTGPGSHLRGAYPLVHCRGELA